MTAVFVWRNEVAAAEQRAQQAGESFTGSWPPGGTMITLERLSKRYAGATVVDDVSMVVEPHTITTIVGTSGSGKSTLLRMINRLVEPSAGRVLIDGQDTALEAAHLLRRRIGYVIQGSGLFPHRTVAENIATVPRLLGWEAARVGARVEELLALFQLDPAEFAGKYPHQLSGGQQQRVGVARALAAEPQLLLMDEPFGALDPIIRVSAQEELRALQRRLRTTVILVTHDIDEAFRLGDRVAVMSRGRLLQHDRPAVLVTAPADPFVAQLIGTTERALRLLSLTTAGELAEPGAVEGPAIAASATLREALAELVWSGATEARVTDASGAPIGRITLAAVLAHGRRAP
jgi:osmoprotectant transport system ATP-binding protein